MECTTHPKGKREPSAKPLIPTNSSQMITGNKYILTEGPQMVWVEGTPGII